MKKYIKLWLSLLLLILIVGISKSSLGLTVTRISHSDPWSGKQEFFYQGGGDTPTGATMCIEKGGTLRFTPLSLPKNGAYHEIVNSSAQRDTTHSSLHCPDYYPSDTEIINTVRNDLTKKIEEKITNLTGCQPLPESGVWAQYFKNAQYSQKSVSGDILAVSKPYTTTPNYTAVESRSNKNDHIAYIMSASARYNPQTGFGLKKGNYLESISDKADNQLVQDAIWCSELNEGRKLSSPAMAVALLNEAKNYEKLVSKLESEQAYAQNTRIIADNAQVIADRPNKKYTIGPFKVIYPNGADSLKFSYIQDIYITDENGNKIATPKVICQSPIYPMSGEEFFVEFSAAEAGIDRKKVCVQVEFAYLQLTESEYTKYKADGTPIKQLVGYLKKEDKSHQASWTDKEEDGHDENGFTKYKDVTKTETCTATRYYGELKSETIGSYDAQHLIEIDKETREWKTYKLGIEKLIPIDLTMELGGYVWVDEEAGKESVQDGKASQNEKRVPNVPVTLYREDGKEVGSTKTDTNGEYRFKELNAMYQYYVKFTYNGQYYQPTTYADSKTWGSSEWFVNSNATDTRSERLSFNLRFASIGSSPENYVGLAGANKSYTKQELLDAGVIDEFGNLIGGSNASMIQYVKDCMMDAYTGPGDGSHDLYPVPEVFVIDTFQYPSMLVPKVDLLYPNAYYINLGLNPREESDLAIKKDVDHVTLEINGQTHTYTYDTLESKPDAEGAWDISVRLSDAYYNTRYSRELYKSDYIYKASMYGDRATELGKLPKDELEVFITYKIMIRNQALSIRARVDEIVDYYDQDLEYVDERSYIQIKSGENTGIYDVKASENTRYSNKTRTTINGYDNLYVTGLDDKYLVAGQTAYVYLTFKVKKDTIDGEKWVKLDEEVESAAAIGVGKENIVEINGYSTQYAPGTQVPNVGDVGGLPAGIVDRDSNPGNLNPSDVPKDGAIKYENFEDDTDKAPNIRIILYRDDNATRVISGNVWEDARTESIEVTTTGDGVRADKETLINGVTVQLVELMENGTEYIWREFGAPANSLGQEIGGANTIGKGTGTGTIGSETPIINYKNLVENYNFADSHDGTYAFKSFMPGKYVVRFIYGDNVRTVTPASLNVGGLNAKSYNGQDFKSTTYQEGITQNRTYTWREASTWSKGQETLGKVLTEITTFKPDASNNETANAQVKTQDQKGYLYDITASDKLNNVSDAKDIESRRNQVVDYSDNDVTNYIAEVLASHKSDYTTMNDRNQLLNDLITNTQMKAETGMMVIELEYDKVGTPGQTVNNTATYKIENVDLGLEERPKAQLVIDKEVTNTKLTLADGSILFDAQASASNVLWKDHKAYNVGYNGNLMDENKFGNIENIRTKNASKFGLVQLTMDEELMHGATVEVTYRITVSNVGEVDYKDNLFYYTGNKSANAPIVTTKANQVIDYVANNLQFNADLNSNWRVIEKDDIQSQGLVNAKLKEQLDKFNTIIITDNLSKDLVPNLYKEKVAKNAEDATSVPLVLTQLITAENDSDDLSYRNLVEIVKTSNLVGRRMEYSVVGNQDPLAKPQELDSDIAEVVRILPPFGNAGIYIIITTIALATLAILTGGIIFIKKKVLKK